jgi:two-component system alkaline phosphatase synthesis response regulator PhoP
MLVDDEPVSLRIVRLALENAGYDVTTAGDGAEALKIMRDRRFDVLVTDLNMPRMNGRELCEAIQEGHVVHEPLIFVLTARPGEGHRVWAKDLENIEFLEKPASLRRLVARIGERLADANAEASKTP